MTKITDDIAKSDYGITCQHEVMENGELRFSLRSEDGSAYVRTVSGKEGAWQNSHYHKSIKETYIVQKGWIAFASLVDDELSLVIAKPGDEFTIEPFTSHNIYLPASGIFHTIKHGISQQKDWFGNSYLDNVSKHLSEDEIMILTGNSSSI